MHKLLKLELKKSFFSKTWFTGLFFLSLFAFLSFLFAKENWGGYNPNILDKFENSVATYDPDFPLYGLSFTWIGADNMSLAQTIFFAILPICVAIPYSWSYQQERKISYLRTVYTKEKRIHYIIAKLISVFLNGFSVTFIAVFLNISLTASFIPNYPPYVGNIMYNCVYFGQIWADLFFNNPVLYIILYAFFISLYGGIFAIISLSISAILRNTIAIIFTPFVLTLVGGYIESLIYNNMQNKLVAQEFIPTRFIHATSVGYFSKPVPILIETIILIILPSVLFIWRAKKDEVM